MHHNNSTKISSLTISSYDKIMRIVLFMLISFVLIRYCLNIQLDDYEQIKIIMATAIAFIFVNLYYPSVIIQHTFDK